MPTKRQPTAEELIQALHGAEEMTCANAYEAFQTGIRYQQLTYLFGSLRFELGEELSCLVLTPLRLPGKAFRFRVDGEASGTYKLVRDMQATPSISDAKANLNLNNPEYQVVINRSLASDLGVRTSDIASAVRLLMSGDDEISTFKEGSEQYPVTMRLLPSLLAGAPSRVVVHIHGRRGSGRKSLIATVCQQRGLRLLRVDAARLVSLRKSSGKSAP